MPLRTNSDAVNIIAHLILALVVCGCSTVKKEGASPHISAVGLWEENGLPVYPVHIVTLRNGDGSFRRKEIKLTDYAKPPIELWSAGQWKVVGNQYWEKLTDISLPIWKGDIGKESKLKILELSENVFKYVSSDGATVVERKIGNPSLAKFNATKLKKIPQ